MIQKCNKMFMQPENKCLLTYWSTFKLVKVMWRLALLFCNKFFNISQLLILIPCVLSSIFKNCRGGPPKIHEWCCIPVMSNSAAGGYSSQFKCGPRVGRPPKSFEWQLLTRWSIPFTHTKWPSLVITSCARNLHQCPVWALVASEFDNTAVYDYAMWHKTLGRHP